ncbi:MAG: MASE1 domain-containing protein, partial [Bryobacteraceae bacterium]
VIFPFLIWASLRFGPRGATTGVFLVSGIAIWGTAHGMGPFSQESLNDSLVLLQTFTGVLALTSLILAATTTERWKAMNALRQRVNDLVILNHSSKTFLNYSELPRVHHTVCRLAVDSLGADAAWIEEPGREGAPERVIAACGIHPEAAAEMKVQMEKPNALSERGCRTRTPDAGGNPPYRSYAAFPLVFGGEELGRLVLLSKGASFFTEERQLLIQSYANLAAVAIQNTRLVEEVRRANRQLHALSQRLIKAQEEERLHLSRELHDEFGQLLAALTVQLGLLERNAEHSEAISERIRMLKQATAEIQDQLHRLAIRLRPASLDHLGLVRALEQYVYEFRRQYNIEVEFEAVGVQDTRLPEDVETALFRIVQESLTNVALHAQATRVDILLSLHDKHVVVIVEDDGIGFTPTPMALEGHLGIFGMRERIEMLGGKFILESAPGKGTTVRVEVPLYG